MNNWWVDIKKDIYKELLELVLNEENEEDGKEEGEEEEDDDKKKIWFKE